MGTMPPKPEPRPRPEPETKTNFNPALKYKEAVVTKTYFTLEIDPHTVPAIAGAIAEQKTLGTEHIRVVFSNFDLSDEQLKKEKRTLLFDGQLNHRYYEPEARGGLSQKYIKRMQEEGRGFLSHRGNLYRYAYAEEAYRGEY